MGGIQMAVRTVVACAAAFASVACATPNDELDLARNQTLYQTPNYHARVPADRSAFVGPVVDAREPVVAADASGPYPTMWMPEGLWQRPLPEMIHECLCDAFDASGVFAGLQEAPPPAADVLIVEPSLVAASAGQEERLFGRRTLATVALRIVVHGPTAGDGSRPILLDEVFEQAVGTDVAPSPPRVPQVFGKALQQVVARLCAAIDQGNHARSGMPVATQPAGVTR